MSSEQPDPVEVLSKELRRAGLAHDLSIEDAHDCVAALAAAGLRIVFWGVPDECSTHGRLMAALVGVGESPRHESDPADVLDDDADYQKAYCWEMHASPDTPLCGYEPAASCCGFAASYHALLAGAQALRATVAPSSPEEPTP